MSEPLSSHEIEDVLSSIRRLVSEELRPAPRPPREETAAAPAPAVVAPPAAPPAVAEPGKLILTPSLRVVGEDWPAAVAAAPAPMDVAPEGASPEETARDGWAPDGAAGVDPVLLHQGLAPMSDAGPAAVPDAVAGDSRAGGPLMDYDEDLVWATAGEPDPDPFAAAPRVWATEPVPHPAWVQPDTDWPEEEPVPFVARPRGLAAEDPLARAWADRAEAEVRARLEEVRMPEPEPETEIAETGIAETGIAAADPAPAAGLFAAGEGLIDEEALRDIVREIIREELAGSLGERITRNVRKLVRIEINRARAAREFD